MRTRDVRLPLCGHVEDPLVSSPGELETFGDDHRRDLAASGEVLDEEEKKLDQFRHYIEFRKREYEHALVRLPFEFFEGIGAQVALAVHVPVLKPVN